MIDAVSGASGYSVTITGPEGAEIRYTTNYADPTAESTLYTGTFYVPNGDTVKAIAILNGVYSEIAEKECGYADMD